MAEWKVLGGRQSHDQDVTITRLSDYPLCTEDQEILLPSRRLGATSTIVYSIVAPVAGTATSSTSSFHLWLLASQEGEQSDVRSY